MFNAICQEFCEWVCHFNDRTHVVMETQYFTTLLQRLLPHDYVCELVSPMCERSGFCDATFTKVTRAT